MTHPAARHAPGGTHPAARHAPRGSDTAARPHDASRFGRLVAAPRTLEAATAVLAIAAVAETVVRLVGRHDSSQEVLALCLLAVCATVPLALLRPLGAAVAMSAGMVVTFTAFHSGTVAGSLALLLGLFQLGRTAERTSDRALAVGLALPFFILVLFGGRPGASEAGLLAVALAALAPAAAWGGIAEAARRRAEENSAAHDVIASTLLEHTARGERARIARELHDVVAHHISMVAVQAEAARVATPGMPPAGAQRLLAIGDTARAALTEMRRLLGVLRTDAASADTPGGLGRSSERHPQPGLAQLADLVDQAREAAGSTTRLVLIGTPSVLDPGVELAAYRITQEALTNARRHAAGAAVDVEVTYSPNALLLRIRDNGPGAPLAVQGATTGGQGLLGMRERASAVGGQLRFGEAASGGFVIEAALPITVPEPQPAPRAEPQPAPRAEPQPAPRAEPQPAPRAEPQPAPRAEPAPTR